MARIRFSRAQGMAEPLLHTIDTKAYDDESRGNKPACSACRLLSTNGLERVVRFVLDGLN